MSVSLPTPGQRKWRRATAIIVLCHLEGQRQVLEAEDRADCEAEGIHGIPLELTTPLDLLGPAGVEYKLGIRYFSSQEHATTSSHHVVGHHQAATGHQSSMTTQLSLRASSRRQFSSNGPNVGGHSLIATGLRSSIRMMSQRMTSSSSSGSTHSGPAGSSIADDASIHSVVPSVISLSPELAERRRQRRYTYFHLCFRAGVWQSLAGESQRSIHTFEHLLKIAQAPIQDVILEPQSEFKNFDELSQTSSNMNINLSSRGNHQGAHNSRQSSISDSGMMSARFKRQSTADNPAQVRGQSLVSTKNTHNIPPVVPPRLGSGTGKAMNSFSIGSSLLTRASGFATSFLTTATRPSERSGGVIEELKEDEEGSRPPFRLKSATTTQENETARLDDTDDDNDELSLERESGYDGADVVFTAEFERFISTRPDPNAYTTRLCSEIARAYIFLFHENRRNYDFLHEAHRYYRTAIHSLPVDLTTMFTLPRLLFEMAMLFEFYGAIESAVKLYTQILTYFPNCRVYFDALYRIGIVGRSLGGTDRMSQTKIDAMNKAIDIFHFFLEAPPSNINEIHLVFLYARTLELSTDFTLRTRAEGVYTSMFLLCKKRCLFGQYIAETEQTNLRPWLTQPLIWLQLAEHIESSGDLLVSKDAYDKFSEESRRLIQSLTANSINSRSHTIQSVISLDSCLKLAQHFLIYHNPTQAKQFAELGLTLSPWDSECRRILSQVSKASRKRYELEKNAVERIVRLWRQRCWRRSVIQSVRELRINELSAALRGERNADGELVRPQLPQWTMSFNDHFQSDLIADTTTEEALYSPFPYYTPWVRDELSYYDKQVSRPLFAYEDFCCRRIQAVWRTYHYSTSSSSFFPPQTRRKPYSFHTLVIYVWRQEFLHRVQEKIALFEQSHWSPSLRQEILYLASHRFLLAQAKHPIHLLVQDILSEKHAVACIERMVRCVSLFRCVKARCARHDHLRGYTSTRALDAIQRIQRFVRRQLHTRKWREILKIRTVAALVIQRAWRNSRKSLRRIIYRERILQRRLRSHAMQVLRTRFLPILSLFLRYRRRHNGHSLSINSLPINLVGCGIGTTVNGNLTGRVNGFHPILTIQRFFRFHLARRALNRLLGLKRQRDQASFSNEAMGHLPSLFSNTSFAYRNPGVNASTLQYQRLLNTSTVVCTPENMRAGAFDFQLLGHVLRDVRCQIHRLVFYRLAVFSPGDLDAEFNSNLEKDCDPSQPAPWEQFFLGLSKCLSIKSIWLLEGHWHAKFISRLLQTAQIDNPRLQELYLERVSVNPHPLFVPCCLMATSRLLLDFMNYSLPGIRSLSLHGCDLKDDHIPLLATGLEVNSSLQSLVLSLNGITDHGLCTLLNSLVRNRKSSLKLLDLSFNLIQLHDELTHKKLREYQDRLYTDSLYVQPCKSLAADKWTAIPRVIDLSFNLIRQRFDPIEEAVNSHSIPLLNVIYSGSAHQERSAYISHTRGSQKTNFQKLSLPWIEVMPLPSNGVTLRKNHNSSYSMVEPISSSSHLQYDVHQAVPTESPPCSNCIPLLNMPTTASRPSSERQKSGITDESMTFNDLFGPPTTLLSKTVPLSQNFPVVSKKSTKFRELVANSTQPYPSSSKKFQNIYSVAIPGSKTSSTRRRKI